MKVLLCVLALVATHVAAFKIVDTSHMVGAEYQPSKSANEDWLYHFDEYKVSIDRELGLVKAAMEFTTVRVFLHSMIYSADPERMLANLDEFLAMTHKHKIGVGLVFFDDCWNHAGLDLNKTCQPIKGHHNGCWMASPQDVERTSVDRFESYVKDTVSRFKRDNRVVWWEIFNEPSGRGISHSLRHAAYNWVKSEQPQQFVMSCWDPNNDTDLVDHHQYALPWSGTQNGVFSNATGLMQGGVVTEAGARWYQGDIDRGSPLTVIDWLTKLRANKDAKFVPGVMIDWEVMVSNSNTRWQWGNKVLVEPVIPWHQHLFPDGSPVSYTEAGAIRRYITGKNDFIFFEDFLNVQDNPDSAEKFLTVEAGVTYKTEMTAPVSDQLVEVTFAPSAAGDSKFSLQVRTSESGASYYEVSVNASSKPTLELTRSLGSETTSLGTFDITSLECGLVKGAWNMLRVLVKGDMVSIWFNPMLPEVFPNGVPMPGEPDAEIQLMPPRISVQDSAGALPPGTVVVGTSGQAVTVDYISVLPPVVLGQAWKP